MEFIYLSIKLYIEQKRNIFELTFKNVKYIEVKMPKRKSRIKCFENENKVAVFVVFFFFKFLRWVFKLKANNEYS